MPPPSPLSIATSSVSRLIKEEASYHKELTNQESRVSQLLANPGSDENAEYQLKQEKAAIEETKAVFPPLRQRINDAVVKLEDKLEAAEEDKGSEEEISKAKEVLKVAKEKVDV